MHPTPLLDILTAALLLSPILVPLWAAAAYAVDLYHHRRRGPTKALIILVSLLLVVFLGLAFSRADSWFTLRFSLLYLTSALPLIYKPDVLLFRTRPVVQNIAVLRRLLGIERPSRRWVSHLAVLAVVAAVACAYLLGKGLSACGALDTRLQLRGCSIAIAFDHSPFARHIALSPDSRYLAVAANDLGSLSVAVFDTGSGELHRNLAAPNEAGSFSASLVWSADSERLAVLTMEGAVLVWARDGNQPLAMIQPSLGDVRAAALSPTGDQVAVLGAEGELQLWELAATPRLITEAVVDGAPFELLFDPGGRYLALATEAGVAVWEPERAQRLEPMAPGTHPMSWSAKAGLLTTDVERAYISSLSDGAVVVSQTRPVPAQASEVRLLPSGVLIGLRHSYSNRIGGEVFTFWYAEDAEPYYELVLPGTSHGSHGLSRDGEWFAVAYRADRTIQIWRTRP